MVATEHTHAENWAEKLELLHQAAIAVAGAHEIEEALQKIADAARQVIGAEMVAIGVPGKPGDPMAHFVVSGISADARARAGHPPMGKGVLGVLLREGVTVRTRDIRQHEAFRGLPENHPWFTSFLGVPVQSNGEIIGDLYLANKIAEEEFTEDDERLAQMLAAHAAVSIQTLRYHKKHEELAVIAANARLAPKIEDEVLQTLFGAGLLLNTINLDDPKMAAEQLRDIQERLDKAILHLRAHLLKMASAYPSR